MPGHVALLGRCTRAGLLQADPPAWLDPVAPLRVAFGQTLQIVTLPYVKAAELAGAGTARILLRHILPNIAGPLLIIATAEIRPDDPVRGRPVIPWPRHPAASVWREFARCWYRAQLGYLPVPKSAFEIIRIILPPSKTILRR
jgi:hypothetical protein